MISIIAIIGRNNQLGKDNKLLWNIPGDMVRFKKITTGHIVIMGRKTFESIGKALPDRRNIIITRNKDYEAKDYKIFSSLDKAIDYAKSRGNEEVFIIGGGEIYKQAMPFADKLYLTIVDDSPEADTFFPNYSKFDKIITEETHETDNLKYTFLEITK